MASSARSPSPRGVAEEAFETYKDVDTLVCAAAKAGRVHDQVYRRPYSLLLGTG
jgi:RNA-splicing ligase RtcB